LDWVKGSQAYMKCNFSEIDSFNLQLLHQMPGKVKTCGWRGYSTFMLGIDGLITFGIFRLYFSLDVFWKWCFTQFFQFCAELFVGSVIKKSKCTASGSCIVYNFGYQSFVFSKEKFITNPDLSGWIYKYIPNTGFLIQFSEQENLNFGSCFLLVAI